MPAHLLALLDLLYLAARGGGGGRPSNDLGDESVDETRLLAAMIFGRSRWST